MKLLTTLSKEGVRQYLAAKGLRTSATAFPPLMKRLARTLDEAAEKAKREGMQTVKDRHVEEWEIRVPRGP